ncbi:unnamed protein product [Fraxinus pennsylvanica]|uniref:Uncharacterized protein n=1 Tax=Fraxinus pennsylvanica TaxID=56036 RepID=A0AAD2E1J2_9LAMI|nr:unnamed protein product [Fraxinus pennsylvanica]
MQRVSPKVTIQRLPHPPRPPPSTTAGSRVERNLSCRNGYQVPPRSNSLYTCSTQHGSRSVRGFWHQAKAAALPSDRLRRRQGNREIIRRALAPPCHRPSWRWWNFRPTPSRLSKMSMV